MKPELTSNMKEYISSGNSNKMTFNLSSILYKIEDTDLLIGFHNILDDYIDEIKKTCKTLHMTKSQLNKYKYKPWLFVYDVYGNSDLEYIILRINNMITAKDFNKSTILVFTGDTLEMINKIQNAEKKYIRMNRNSLE